jgi:Tol biopolymer transport system component
MARRAHDEPLAGGGTHEGSRVARAFWRRSLRLRQSEQQVWFVPYPKGEARRITNDLMDYRDLGITADAKTVITIQSEKKANLWIAAASDLDHPTQLTSTSYDGLNGISWTPDSKIVYTSQINGEQNLWITSRTEPEATHCSCRFQRTTGSIPDGRYIVFLRTAMTRNILADRYRR